MGGIMLLFVDARAAAVWMVNGLFFGAAALFSYSGIRSLALTVLFAIFFVAHGIGAPLFFLHEKNYTVSSWTAVGRFDFTIVSFLQAYTPVFVLCTLLLLAGRAERALFRRRQSRHDANVRSEALAKVSSVNDWKLFLFSAAMCALNYWMYVNNVDVSGVPPVALPFKLTGALHYLRLIVLPLGVVYLLSQCRHFALCGVVVMCTALFISLCSGSRTLLVLNLVPVAVVFYHRKGLGQMALVAIVVAVTFPLVSAVKVANYDRTGDLIGVVASAYKGPPGLETVLEVPTEFVTRVHGPQQVVLSGQYPEHDPVPSVARFLAGGEPVTDSTEVLYGFVFSSQDSFGTGNGLIGNTLLATNGSALYMLPIVCVVAIGVFALNRVEAAARTFGRPYLLLIQFGIFVAMYVLNDGFMSVFMGTTALLVGLTVLMLVARSWLRESRGPFVVFRRGRPNPPSFAQIR